jgi:hypothetical protein
MKKWRGASPIWPLEERNAMTTTPQPLPLGPLIAGAFNRVRYAIPQHVALTYIYILPVLLLLVPGLFDDVLATFITHEPVGGALWQSLLFLVLMVIWGSAIVVVWYRLTLLGPGEFLRLDVAAGLDRTMRFIGISLLVGIITGVAFLLMIMATALVVVFTSKALAPLAFAVSMAVALATGLRFLPSLAAVPLGRRIPLSASWQLTRNKGGRLLMAALALVLPVAILSGVVDGLVMHSLYGAAPDESAPLAEAVSYMRSSFLISVLLAPLSCAATAFVCGLGAEVYARLVGAPLDVRGMEV